MERERGEGNGERVGCGGGKGEGRKGVDERGGNMEGGEVKK